MSTFLGGSEISEMYLGSNEVSEMYLGSDLIYSSSSSSSDWPYKTLRISKDGGITWEDYGRPAELEEFQFISMGITHVELPDSVTSIGREAFRYNKIETVDIPESVKTIGRDAFTSNRLTYVEFPETLELIDIWAFRANPNLAEVRVSSRTSFVTSPNRSPFDDWTKVTIY